jgi:drug/metabolite transporter (DMT)-like permease
MVGGALVLAPVGLWQLSGTDWSRVTGGAWAGLAYSAIGPAALASVIVFHAIRLLGPTRITALQFLVPFIAVLIGAAFLAAEISAGQLVGGAVIIAGVVVARRIGVGGLVDRIREGLAP